jgi:agmatine deiminase
MTKSAPSPKAPAALGFRMPAEWEPQASVWFSWPHNHATWPGQFRPVPGVFAEIVAQISRFEAVHINCAAKLQPRAKRLCTKASANMARVTFHKYPPYDLDNKIPPRIAQKLGLRRFENDMVLEGGSIDVNGQGLLLTSEQCLLNKNRNPHLSRAQIERNLKDYLGVTQVLWLGEGIVGDDTDGHIDDMTRFFRPDGLITCVEPNRHDLNHWPLAENLERLRSFRTPAGRKFAIVELPMPKPFGFRGQQVPASYANFLIINGAVLVPQFRQKRRDAEARAILGDCFKDREIVPIDCYHLIWGLGTLHCISQQQPA